MVSKNWHYWTFVQCDMVMKNFDLMMKSWSVQVLMLGLEDTLQMDRCCLEYPLMVTVDCGTSKRSPVQMQHQMSWRNELIAMGAEQHFHKDCVNCVAL